MMGKQAKAMNLGREMERWSEEQSGPRPKEKRRSLKFASQETKKEVVPVRWTEVRLRGRKRKRPTTGRVSTSLRMPLLVVLEST